jgi:C1A family cysteine protease
MRPKALAPRSFILLSVAVIATSGPADCATTESAATNPPPPESALWPARFPRTLMSANDVKAAKARSAARPNKFDLLPWQTPIKNQGKRDTCYAFAFTAGLEAAYRHKYGKVVDGRYQGPQ